MLRSHLSCRVFAGIALLCAAVSCLGQESRGSITGKVMDPTDALIPGASVVVTNVGTGVPPRLSTNQSGYYEVNFLIPGSYSVEASSAGFKKTVRRNITLDTGARLATHHKLEIRQTRVAGG